MSVKLWRLLTALGTCLLALLYTVAAPTPANAIGTPSIITWPGVELPYGEIYAHGDGSFTVAKGGCGTSSTTSTPSLATYDSSFTYEYVVNKVPETGWTVDECEGTRVMGNDNTLYFAEHDASGHFKIVAMQKNTTIWTFVQVSTWGEPSGLALGFDGNLYFTVSNSTSLLLVGLDTGTGSQLFANALPSSSASYVPLSVMPYDSGLAVANNNSVYYYDYGTGSTNTGVATFSPAAPTGSVVAAAQVTTTGRTYLAVQRYNGLVGGDERHLYFRDLSSSTINEISLPSSGTTFAYSQLRVTPAGGAVILNGTTLSYYDSSGSDVYDESINAHKFSYLVDNLGNLVVESTVGLANGDEDVIVDTYSSSGTKTNVFDADDLYGTSSLDVFETNTDIVPQSLGGGNLYIALCHRTSFHTYYDPYRECASADSPEVVAIPMPGTADYPKSGLFSAIDSMVNYVALGDSYSSGEGNPAFMTGTDNDGGDGCDRSINTAFPVLLGSDTSLHLTAFRACSGATTQDVTDGMNGETSQLSSLSDKTDLVTISVGGDDAYFAAFATECVIGTCDADSSQYQDTMDKIDNDLQDNLVALFANIRSKASTASLIVVGYPAVVAPGGNCPVYLSSGEQIAVETVVTSLNNKLSAAVSDSGTGFQFIDPTISGSPFEGHDLCSSESYFFGLNIAEHGFSFHPNADGQAAYEELISNLI